MSQLMLFPDLDADNNRARASHGAIWQVGDWHCRNWEGFYQCREAGAGRWLFQIPWFSNDGVTCTVYVLDSEGEVRKRDGIPIDAQGRILINGLRYGRNTWHH